MTDFSSRKVEHIQAFDKDPLIERPFNHFDAYRLNHRALPEINFDAVTTETHFLGKALAMPLLISSMTGGSDASLTQLNKQLAQVAQEHNIGLAVGSQRIMLSHPEAITSFQIRRYAPDVPLIANMGAVQLNYGVTVSDLERVIETLEADALYLHLNPLQECIQPEGNRDFSNLVEQIHHVSEVLSVPVILKEVGAGFSTLDLQHIAQTGIRWLDVSGSGGTSWSRVEHHRRMPQDDLGLTFQDWGTPTPEILIAAAAELPKLGLIASGGIRNGLDMAKSLALGAQMCGMAAPLLKAAQQGNDSISNLLNTLQMQLKTVLFLCGQSNIKTTVGNQDIITYNANS